MDYVALYTLHSYFRPKTHNRSLKINAFESNAKYITELKYRDECRKLVYVSIHIISHKEYINLLKIYELDSLIYITQAFEMLITNALQCNAKYIAQLQ